MKTGALMRRIHAAVAASAVLALGLLGCSSGSNSGPSSGSGQVQLTMSAWADDTVAAALIKKFEADNPGVTIKYTGLPFPGILTQINTQLVSGTGSDIVVVFPGNGNPITAQTLAKGNYLANLSSAPWAQKFSAVNRAVMGADGKILMGANNFTIVPALYNTAALKSVGATPPTTFSQVLQLCQTAKAKGKVAYAMSGLAGGNFYLYPYALTATLVYGPNPDFVSQQTAGTASFSNSGWVASLGKFKQMIDAGCFTNDSTGTNLQTAQAQVAKGDALGMVAVSNQIETIEGMAPANTAFETAAFPATDDPSQTVLPVGLGSGYGVNAKSQHSALAEKFLNYFMSQQGMTLANKAGSIFPSIPIAGYTPIPALAGVAQQARSAKTAAFPDQTWPNSNVAQVYQDQLQAFINGSESASAVLTAMDNAFKG
jgi:raffinose/stachyose/melibiose transport system substrate-binding protein